jgi:hypothetical protein
MIESIASYCVTADYFEIKNSNAFANLRGKSITTRLVYSTIEIRPRRKND